MRAIFLAFPIMLAGCSHAYVSQYDKDTVTTCCPTEKLFCTNSKLENLAKEQCGGSISLIGAGTRATGGVSLQRNLFNGAILGASEDQEKCELFKCGDRNPAAK